jgi:hypothetical protein
MALHNRVLSACPTAELASVLSLLLGVAEPERYNVLRTNEQSALFDVCQESRTVPGREGKIHRCGLAIRFRSGW